MKIFKFYQVDSSTGISIAIEPSREGPTNPNFAGLEELITINGWRYAYVSDEASQQPSNYIYEITQEEFNQDVLSILNTTLEQWKTRVYESEKELRIGVFGRYDSTAQIAGIYKYDLAKNFLQNNTSSSELSIEANLRGIGETELCQKIIDKHEKFRTLDAKIAGLRGKIYDRLNSFTINQNNPFESWKELVEKTEKLGTRTNPIGEETDFNFSYYSPELSIRWEFVDK